MRRVEKNKRRAQEKAESMLTSRSLEGKKKLNLNLNLNLPLLSDLDRLDPGARRPALLLRDHGLGLGPAAECL